MTPEDTKKLKVIVLLYQARAVLRKGRTVYAYTQMTQLSLNNC